MEEEDEKGEKGEEAWKIGVGARSIWSRQPLFEFPNH